jgi:hypothetical protein
MITAQKIAATIAEEHPAEAEHGELLAEEIMHAALARNIELAAALAFIRDRPRQQLSAPFFLRWCERNKLTPALPWPKQRADAIEAFPAGATHANTPPEARGIPLTKWMMQQITKQCDEIARANAGQEAPLSRKAIATHRDGYGWRSGHENRGWLERKLARLAGEKP